MSLDLHFGLPSQCKLFLCQSTLWSSGRLKANVQTNNQRSVVGLQSTVAVHTNASVQYLVQLPAVNCQPLCCRCLRKAIQAMACSFIDLRGHSCTAADKPHPAQLSAS